ncbi:DUF3616 domain-containing protein [Chitinilyticum piscinae]|uniref:DUF3616 domain-containing protein n=1 Tax=Chitinilyticum piscinae TaxID=2866724 RepID=A0A8J7FHK0_9NEIS|nr:DUF3616 domain-containing protein [Chitinilyticum piscinae]MBE9608325.1 DUF3616 domain-containing protein [Chitinilyticum piscinae]
MPRQLQAYSVRLEFTGEALVHANLSGAAFVNHDLWVAGDEAAGLMRLSRLEPVAGETLRFGEARFFRLADYLDLPAAAEIEADLEGLAYFDGYLWLLGSHGLKRKAPKAGRSISDNLKRLATLSQDGNRCLLARIPVLAGTAGSELVRKTADGRTAAILSGNERENELTARLADDPHWGAYLAIPGKDNGFDLEGLAARDGHLLLGLRGPVLRGWSGLLEVRPRERDGALRLGKLGEKLRYRKHFVKLAGLGVRDLLWDGDDLFILAGPTMVLDGAIRVFRWDNAAAAFDSLPEDCPAMLWEQGPQEVFSLPHGLGQDRAEAITRLPQTLLPGAAKWLVLYDAPSAARSPELHVVLGDLLLRDPLSKQPARRKND